LNDYVLAALLGVVEGATEFLPVSSTAHLRLTEAVLQIDLADPFWKLFTIVIQLGAVLCLPFYFHARIRGLLATFPTGERGDRGLLTHPLGLVWVAFVVTALPAFLLIKLIGQQLESLLVMGTSLLIGGVVMWIVDARSDGAAPIDRMERMSLGQAIWIGACQTLSAIFPGTSRSMTTIAAGEIAGMTRTAALEFSFFVSLPTLAAATLYALLKSLKGDASNPIGVSHIDPHGWVLLLVGFTVAFVVAYLSVVGFMAWVRRYGLAPFAIYRFILGAAVLGRVGGFF
jgi:undecaprenyl-diphosphatase